MQIKLADLKNGTEKSKVFTSQTKTKRKTHKLLLERIKLCSLNHSSREVIFKNEFGLKPNKFEDMCENVVQSVEKLGYNYKLFDWQPTRIIYLVTPDNLPNTVRDKTASKIANLSGKLLQELDSIQFIPTLDN